MAFQRTSSQTADRSSHLGCEKSSWGSWGLPLASPQATTQSQMDRQKGPTWGGTFGHTVTTTNMTGPISCPGQNTPRTPSVIPLMGSPHSSASLGTKFSCVPGTLSRPRSWQSTIRFGQEEQVWETTHHYIRRAVHWQKTQADRRRQEAPD